MKDVMVKLASGKTAFRWSNREKPSLNHWYQLLRTQDYWKIQKDFHCKETNQTYYRIAEYYYCEIVYSGITLAKARDLIRDNTYRMVT